MSYTLSVLGADSLANSLLGNLPSSSRLTKLAYLLLQWTY